MYYRAIAVTNMAWAKARKRGKSGYGEEINKKLNMLLHLLLLLHLREFRQEKHEGVIFRTSMETFHWKGSSGSATEKAGAVWSVPLKTKNKIPRGRVVTLSTKIMSFRMRNGQPSYKPSQVNNEKKIMI